MTDCEGKRTAASRCERYTIWFVCLVTDALDRRGGYAANELEQALRDAKYLHGLVVRESDGASTTDGKTWRRGRETR